VRVVHDDDEVSSDEDEPLQVRLRSLFPAGGSSSLGTASPIVVAVEAAGAEAATDRRAAEEAATKEAAGEAFLRSGRQKGGDAKWLLSTGQTTLQGRLETLVCPKVIAPLSVLFSFCEAHYFSFPSSRSSPAPRAPSVATVVSSVAPAAGATVPAVAAEVVPELVASGTP
jgi:hypothetical protein